VNPGEKSGGPVALAKVFSGLFTTSIYSNFIWSMAGLGLSKAARFLGVVVCIRLVGNQTWGQVTSTLVILSLLGIVVDQGLSASPQVFKVNDRALDKTLFRKISLYRLCLAGLLIAGLHAAAPVLHLNPLLPLYAWVLIPRSLTIDWLFHRREHYYAITVVNCIRAALFFGFVAALVKRGTGPRTIIFIEIAAETGGLLFSYAILAKLRLFGSIQAKGLAMRELLVFSAPILINSTLSSLPISVDVVFLRYLCGYEILAQYDIGGKIGLFYFFIGATLVLIMLPKLARLHAENDIARARKILASSSKMLTLLCGILLIPSFFYARELLELCFSRSSPLTILVFQWIPVWVALSCLTMQSSAVLLGIGRRDLFLYGAILSALSNIAATWILVTRFSASGAVFARIISESLLFIYYNRVLPDRYRSGFQKETVAQILSLALMIGLFLLHSALGQRPLFLALSIATLLAFVAYLRIFSRETLAVLMDN
jgi:O-antigen/teichoic acid export membrane protein